MRAEDEMEKFFMRDMKNYECKNKTIEQSTLFKTTLWAVIAVIALTGITGKMSQDEESFKVEQSFKMACK